MRGWWIVIALWLIGPVPVLLQGTEGIHEDHVYMQAAASLNAPPTIWQARGLTQHSIWVQRQTPPAAFRAVNLALAFVVAVSVAAVASALGLPGWVAAGVMLLHPLMVETVAMLAGRGELIAAIGIVWACWSVTKPGAWRVSGVLIGAAIGWLGKESAAVGLVLVPLTAIACGRDRAWFWRSALALGAVALGVGLWMMRMIGETVAIRVDSLWWLLRQASAAARLMALSILPIGQTIDFDYGRLSRAWQIGAVAQLGTLAACAIAGWRRDRALAFGVLWMVLVTVPRLIVRTPNSEFNEHQFYLALVGFAFVVAAFVRPFVVANTAAQGV